MIVALLATIVFILSACLLLFRAVVFHPHLSALARFCPLMRALPSASAKRAMFCHGCMRPEEVEINLTLVHPCKKTMENCRTNDSYLFGWLSDLCRWRRLVQQLHLHLFVDIVVTRVARYSGRLNLLGSRFGPRKREREKSMSVCSLSMLCDSRSGALDSIELTCFPSLALD